ncbi:MAG: hypothetical protein Q4Q53_02880 [Methanocorpusculum sp.]|nr:hypothetical protein [Methanocorpusculum sp.]
MSRHLSEYDIALLLKLAPECNSLMCSKSESNFRSILPPVGNHFAKDADDFARRLNGLSQDEFVYLIDLVRCGKEGIGCLPTECAEVLIEITIERVGSEAANELYALYEEGNTCE